MVGEEVATMAAVDSGAVVDSESFSELVGGNTGNDLSGDDIKSTGMTISLGSGGGTALGSRDLTRSL